ncbi:immune inhibitor A [Streptomyces sp. PTM05]|uniref:Immune inhibitor A n=1 Tax=Streptantibioticus parmotrematis TaxID=2873249 RepID=A0ABS7QYR9_9ACTN|nr:immune inhibitor A [Streptantibioticus parmotrematis]MBY8886934.1 immune inhibitor A [Streptantibioticus parmotrematis]
MPGPIRPTARPARPARRSRRVVGALAAVAVAAACAAVQQADAATPRTSLAAQAASTAHPDGTAARPAASSGTRRVLFDDTKAETAGNADWIISTSQPDPTAQNPDPTKETDWTGAISAWGVALQQTGDYSLDTLPSGDSITYGTSGALDLKNFDAFVLPEPNILLTSAEKTALMEFVQNGGGLFLISDHNGSDRNNDGADSPKIINDLMTNNSVDSSDPFGFSVDLLDISSDSPKAISDPSDPVLNGPFGTVTGSSINDGTTFTLKPSDNSSVKGLVYRTGYSGDTGAFFVTSTFGSGRVAIWGDSSTIDDGTGQSGKTLYNGWNTASNADLALNATAWLSGATGGGGTTTGGTSTGGTTTGGTTGGSTTGGTTTGGTTTGGTTTGGGGTCSSGQLLANPGFESGNTGWTATSGVISTSSKEPAHSGSYKAWLNGYGDANTATLAQTVTIPSGCSASLSFWLHVDTAETTSSTAYDTLKAQVLSSSGTVLGTLATYSNLNAASGYTQRTFDLSGYAGQTVTVKFTGTEDAQKQTSFVIDDTALNVG